MRNANKFFCKQKKNIIKSCVYLRAFLSKIIEYCKLKNETVSSSGCRDRSDLLDGIFVEIEHRFELDLK